MRVTAGTTLITTSDPGAGARVRTTLNVSVISEGWLPSVPSRAVLYVSGLTVPAAPLAVKTLDSSDSRLLIS